MTIFPLRILTEYLLQLLTPNKSIQYYTIIGHVFFIAYLLGTIIYYKERLLNCDAAYYTFHIINYEEVFVKHQRYISYLTQWAPLLMIKLGGSLKMVLISYSAIFGILFYGLFTMVTHLFKNPKGGILMAIALGGTMRYKHYAGHTEITIAILVGTVLITWLLTDKSKLNWFSRKTDWLIKLLLIFLLYIIHPIIIVPLAVILAADFLFKKRWYDSHHWGFLALLGATFILRFITVSSDSYESGKIGVLSKGWEVFSNPGEYYVFEIVQRFFVNEYIPILILFCGSIYWLTKYKKYLTALVLIVGSSALLGLIIITYSYLRGDLLLMIDGYLGMLGMVWGYAIFLAIDSSSKQFLWVILISCLLLYSLQRIWEKHQFLEKRLDNYEKTFQLHPDNNKLFAPLSLHDWDKFWYPYEIPFETLMLSSLSGKNSGRTIFVDYDVVGTDGYLDGTDYFINFNIRTPLNKLNPKFFTLPDDQNYIRIRKTHWKEVDH